MPKRRGFNASGIGAVSNTIFDALLKQYIHQQDMTKQAELTRETQKQQQGIDTAQSMLPGIVGGQIDPGRVPSAIAQNLPGGADLLYSLAPSAAQQEQPGLEQLRKATNQAEVPDIQTLISERAARGRIGAPFLPTLMPGQKQDTQFQHQPLSGTLSARENRLTDIGKSQEAEMDRQIATASGITGAQGREQERLNIENFPAELQREIEKTTQVGDLQNKQKLSYEGDMNAILGRRAGLTAGASARAQAAVEFDPVNVRKRLDEKWAEATINARAAGNERLAKNIEELSKNSQTGLLALSQLKVLYDKVKLQPEGLTSVGKVIERYLLPTGAQQFINSDVATLDRLAGGYMMLIYRGYGGTGQSVSDKDMDLMKGAIPWSYVLAETGDEVFARATQMLEYQPLIMARYGHIPGQEGVTKRLEVVRQWTEAAAAAPKAADYFKDPTTGDLIPISR